MLAGIDIGGTFTDLVGWEEGRIRIYKLPSSPERPDSAFFRGLDEGGMEEAERVVHGSTVAINALLERKGARTAFVTTRGFADMLAIGRQVRPRLYDLMVEKETPLIPPELCLGVKERVGPRGEVLEALSENEAMEAADFLQEREAEAVAVSLLFSFEHPQHEEILGEVLRSRGFKVYLSCRVLPEYREYERASTVAVNAYVATVVEDYMSRLEQGLSGKRLEVMHSGGGTMSTVEAGYIPARTLMSGPAGGVVAAARTAEATARPQAITLDMGGTSTDVSLVDGGVTLTAEGRVAGLPLRFPMIDIHSIGAGGGSVARADAGGALKVGPESAGADPGPACYGKGSQPTVTDANVVLGRLLEESFLGGRMRLYPERAAQALQELAGTLGWSIKEAAAGVLSVVLAHMAGAVRVMTVDRGHDPADFTLVAFGGAGPMHCCELAELLGVRQVLVPPCPGTFSALGLLMADRVCDTSRTLMLPLDSEAMAAAGGILTEMREEASRAWGGDMEEIGFQPALDLRYRGQSYELMVDAGDSGLNPVELRDDFNRAHGKRYGYHLPDAQVELVNVRLRSILASSVLLPRQGPYGRSGGGVSGRTTALFGVLDGKLREEDCLLMDRKSLVSGDKLEGPCLALEEDATTVVPPAWRGEVDGGGNILLRREGG
jgi:N-methylhydantoinase A